MDIACTNEKCQNFGKVAPDDRSSLYHKQGSQKAGCQTYKCLECGEMFHVEHYVFIDGNKDPDKALQIARLLLARNQLMDISLKTDLSIVRIKSYISYIHKVMSEFESYAYASSEIDLVWLNELCPGLPITVEFEKDTLYIARLRFSPAEHKKAKSLSSATSLLIESEIKKMLAIFDQKFRGQRIGIHNDILNIFRIYYNFSKEDPEGRTPAAKIGIKDQPMKLQQLLSLEL